jgi:hypothetical protein
MFKFYLNYMSKIVITVFFTVKHCFGDTRGDTGLSMTAIFHLMKLELMASGSVYSCYVRIIDLFCTRRPVRE